MTDIANNPTPPESGEIRTEEVDALLERVHEIVARTREVIQATQERLGPPPGTEPGAD